MNGDAFSSEMRNHREETWMMITDLAKRTKWAFFLESGILKRQKETEENWQGLS